MSTLSNIPPYLNSTYIGLDKAGIVQLRCAGIQDVNSLEDIMTRNEIGNSMHLLEQHKLVALGDDRIRLKIKELINIYISSKDSGFIVVALLQKDLVGYSIHTIKSSKNGPSGSFSQVFIADQCVNQGLETSMMQKALEISLYLRNKKGT